jgi:hypothetical protein
MIQRKFFRSVKIAREVCGHGHKTVIAFGRSLHECGELLLQIVIPNFPNY